MVVSVHVSQSVQRSTGAAGEAAERFESYTKVGDRLPRFTVTTLEGKRISSTEMKGKVVVLNLWATWCAPCRTEMPRLEKEIWRYSDRDDFAMIAIARKETDAQIAAFRKTNGFTFPMAADPDGSIFGLFAGAGIPRTYVIGRDGTVVYQSLGYRESEFALLKSVVAAELQKARK